MGKSKDRKWHDDHEYEHTIKNDRKARDERRKQKQAEELNTDITKRHYNSEFDSML